MLKLGLLNEKNPNRVRIICSDMMKVTDIHEDCDIVTMIGSTRMESRLDLQLRQRTPLMRVRGVLLLS